MRTKLLLTLALPGVILIAGGATAQQRGGGDRPTVEGYLCTFAGKCDGVEAPQATRNAPATKGFRLARPVAESNASATPAARPERHHVDELLRDRILDRDLRLRGVQQAHGRHEHQRKDGQRVDDP